MGESMQQLSIDELRRRYRAKKAHAHQRTDAKKVLSSLGHAANRAKGTRHTDMAIAFSKEGKSLEEAAALLGMNKSSLRKLLYKRLGTGRWPVVQDDLTK